ncbi:MAG: phosphopantetheine-binding protein [Planctomycetota bacterium]
MSHRSLEEIVTEVLEEQGKSLKVPLQEQCRLREDLGFDSLELAILTVRIEAEFGVDVFAEGIVSTLGEIQAKLGS